jgi:hypothetical protein
MSPRVLYAVALCALAPAFEPASAHHAFSAVFDVNKPIVLTGTVTKVEWQNPHTWFYFDVKDESGAVANWGMEMSSPNALIRAGWTRGSMKAGDVIMVDGYQARDGTNTGNAKTVTLVATGKQLLTGSSAEAKP